MDQYETLSQLIDRIADIANSVQTKLNWFLGFGVVASAVLVRELYSNESALWWNTVKCGLVVLPVLVWVGVWLVLNQLREAPQLVAELANDDEGVFANLSDLNLKEPNGLRGVYRTIREFREEDGLDVIFDTLSGIALIANPLFFIAAFLSIILISMLIIIAPFMLLL